MTWNTNNISEATNLYTQFQATNAIMNTTPASLFLYALFIVLLIVFRFAGMASAMLASSFICLIFGIIFIYLNLVSWLILTPFIIMLFGGIIYIMVNRG